MFTNATYNILILEEIDKLPFSKEFKDYTQYINWCEFRWNAFGLPSYQSEFVVTNNILYYETGADGKTNIRKEDFTGQVLINGVFVNPNNCGLVFFLTFELHFYHGILQDSELKECKIQPYEEYNINFLKFSDTLERAFKRNKSWWFRGLYKPYFYVLSWITTAIVFIVEFILKLFCMLVEKMLPYKL